MVISYCTFAPPYNRDTEAINTEGINPSLVHIITNVGVRN